MIPGKGDVVVVLTNMSGLAHGDLPRAVTNAALGWDPVPAAAPFSARIAIWSVVTAPWGSWHCFTKPDVVWSVAASPCAHGCAVSMSRRYWH